MTICKDSDREIALRLDKVIELLEKIYDLELRS